MAMLMQLWAKLYSLFNSRYVNKFIPVKQPLSPGKKELTTEAEKKLYANILEAVANVKKLVPVYPVIKELNELVYLDMIDMPDVKFALQISNGDAEVKIGWDINKDPDFVLPVHSYNMKNLVDVTKSGELKPEILYRIIRVWFVPFLRGLYQADYSHLPEDKSYMQLDNFIQVIVKNPGEVEVEGFPGPAQATAVNVDHQWLIFEGWQGDPDVRYEMDVFQALEFAYLIRVKLIKGRPNLSELHEIVNKYNVLKKATTVYERSWH